MSGVINFRNENGSTIFELNNLSLHAKQRIFREYQTNFQTRNFNRNCIKLISNENVLEISNNYISFFPELSPDESEQNYKKIYKLVAQRSEIYLNNSREKIELATQLLLGNDLRACISLLYYSLHNFTTGKIYQFLNERLTIDEHNVSLQEVDHFTSQLFYNDIFKLKTNISDLFEPEMTLENYHSYLGGNKNKLSANPYKIIPLIVNIPKNEPISYIYHHLDFLYKELFGHELCNKNPQVLETVIQIAGTKTKDRSIKQENEVRASIAYAFLQLFNSTSKNEELVWALYIISLRLYWLRQNADYDYDFAVKTSTREVCLLLNAVQHFIKSYFDGTFANKEDEISPKFQENSQNKIKDKQDIAEEYLIQSLTYFDTDLEHLFKNDIPSTAYIYMTAIHLDGDFDYRTMIHTINFSPNITNRINYYIYEVSTPYPISINIKLNKDGRWIFWIDEDLKSNQTLTQNDLIIIFDKFCSFLWNNFNDLMGNLYTPILYCSYPKYSKTAQTIDTLSVKSIHSTYNSLIDRSAWILSILMYEVADFFSLDYQFPILQFDEFNIYCRLSFDIDTLAFGLPVMSKINQECTEGDLTLLVFNLHVPSNVDRPYLDGLNLFHIYSELTMPDIEEIDPLSLGLTKSGYSEIELEVIEKSLLEEDFSPIFKIFTSFMNDIAYKFLENGKFDISKRFLDKCLLLDECDSFTYATYGMFYLRNTGIEDLEHCLKIGSDYYNKAIDLAAEDHPDSVDLLKQKYHYELARFYVKRKFDIDNYRSHSQEGINIGKHFYKDFSSLEIDFKKLVAG